jgi:uncharacterized protein YraI
MRTFSAALLILIFVHWLPQTNAQEEVVVTAEVVYEALNLRSDPNIESSVIAVLERGAVLVVQGYYPDYSPTSGWLKVIVRDSNLNGWVNAKYVMFSRADWRHFVTPLAALMIYPEIQHPPLVATVRENNLIVHASAGYGRPEVGRLSAGQEILVFYERMDTNYLPPSFVYIETRDGTLKGWVYRYYLYFPTWEHNRDLPMQDATAPAEPITIQGQGIGYVDVPLGLNLRTAPTIEASEIRLLPENTLLALYGRTNHELEGWLYVTVIETGDIGWVFDPRDYSPAWVRYPIGLEFDSMPLLDRTSPQQIQAEGLSQITATTQQTIPLSEFTNTYVDMFTFIPSNTALTLTGRNVNGEWYQTNYEGWTGWVWYGNLEFDGAPYRLPIISLHEGQSKGYSLDQ